MSIFNLILLCSAHSYASIYVGNPTVVGASQSSPIVSITLNVQGFDIQNCSGQFGQLPAMSGMELLTDTLLTPECAALHGPIEASAVTIWYVDGSSETAEWVETLAPLGDDVWRPRIVVDD